MTISYIRCSPTLNQAIKQLARDITITEDDRCKNWFAKRRPRMIGLSMSMVFEFGSKSNKDFAMKQLRCMKNEVENLSNSLFNWDARLRKSFNKIIYLNSFRYFRQYKHNLKDRNLNVWYNSEWLGNFHPVELQKPQSSGFGKQNDITVMWDPI